MACAIPYTVHKKNGSTKEKSISRMKEKNACVQRRKHGHGRETYEV